MSSLLDPLAECHQLLLYWEEADISTVYMYEQHDRWEDNMCSWFFVFFMLGKVIWFCCGLLQLLKVGRCVGDVVSSETLHSPTCPCKSSWKRHFLDSCWSRLRVTSQQHLGGKQRHERMAVIFTEDAGKSCQRQFVRWLMLSETPFKNITDSKWIKK